MMQKEKLTMVVFGGTGDLAKRKLFPAFAELISDSIIAKNSLIVGIAREDLSDEDYKKIICDSLELNGKTKEVKSKLENVRIKYLRADFSQKDSGKKLKEFLDKYEDKENDRIYYLATSYKLFPNIVNELKNNGLHKNNKSGGFTRIVFEKPFGNDLDSSNELDKEIHKVFSEDQIFRIDHYLGKDSIQNINVLKFTNPLFLNILNSKFVSKIEVIVDEDIGVGNRLAFYNETGTIKDMIQNHLLQVLSLILMDKPKDFSAESIHNEKVKVLKKIKVSEIKEHLIGQYLSYKNELEKNNISDFKTETFAKIGLTCDNEIWKGVKIYLKTGKKLPKRYGQIVIILNKIDNLPENKIIIDIQPEQDIKLIVNTKKPDSDEISEISLDFMHSKRFGVNTVGGYEELLEDVIENDKRLFTRSDELMESWRIIENIEKIKSKIKFVYYKDGSDPEN